MSHSFDTLMAVCVFKAVGIVLANTPSTSRLVRLLS